MITILNNKKMVAVAILLAGFLIGFSIIRVQAAANDSVINFKKDPSSGLFSLTVKDPDGIQEFSMTPAGKFPYGGGLSGCPKTFSINNISFNDPVDFEPVMPAYVIDCKNNTAKLEIAPPKDGLTVSKTTAVTAVKEEPASLPKEEPKKLGKKEGSLSAADIQYPVPELGNCQNETECLSYCDNAARAKECLAFAKKYNLISEKEAKIAADKFLNVKNGPGGCNSWASCENYCNNVDHLNECIVFAEETGYYSGNQLSEAKKFQALVKSGKQFPGNCKDRNSCEIYCTDPNNMEECLNFAEEAGFLPKEEIEQARKILPLMKQGKTPGGCTSKEQCENYCLAEEHLDECIAFADKAGLLSDEEKELIKKTGGKGPGGCRSKDQCEAYCQINQEECFAWAQTNGLINESDLKRMREGSVRLRESLDKMPPEVIQCLKDNVGETNFNKLLEGQPVFDRSLEGKMKTCFSQISSQLSQQLNTLPPEASQCIKDAVGEEGLNKIKSSEFDENFDFDSLEGCLQQLQTSFGGAGGFSGPGGCKSIEECTAYCQTNPKECQQFAPPGEVGGFPDNGATQGELPGGAQQGGKVEFSGPGGCKSIEECVTYCTEHYTDSDCSAYIGGGSTQTGQCVPPPSGLVNWWNGESLSGASGGVTKAEGKVGQGFKFDGSGSINAGNPANLNFGTGPFSLETWFNWDGSGGVNNIIRKSDYPSSGLGSGYWLRVGNGILEFSVGATIQAEGQTLITSPVSSGAWHHAVGTKDDSGNVKLYVDGQSRGTILRQALNTNSTSDDPFTIGSWRSSTEFFSGLIDEVSVYNRALSASEVQNIFNAGNTGKCSVSSNQPQQSPVNIPTQYKVDCSLFSAAPKCEYVGAPGSQGYNLCKQCFPDR